MIFRHIVREQGWPVERASIISWASGLFFLHGCLLQSSLSFHQAPAATRSDLILGVGGQPERGLHAASLVLTYKVPNEGTVEVGDLLHASRDVGGSRGATGVTTGLFFVVVITKDKAQQEPRHHNVPNAQHREVTASGAGTQSHTSGRPPVTTPLLRLCKICQLFKKSKNFSEWWKETSSS